MTTMDDKEFANLEADFHARMNPSAEYDTVERIDFLARAVRRLFAEVRVLRKAQPATPTSGGRVLVAPLRNAA